MVLVVLAAAVLVVFGCLGWYVLTYFTSTVPADKPDAMQTGNTPTAPSSPTPSPAQTQTPIVRAATPTETATPTPEETPTPKIEAEPTATQTPEATPTPQPTPRRSTGPSQDDLGYLACVQPILIDLGDMLAHAGNLGMESPLTFCAAWPSLGYVDAADYLVMISFSCPQPDSDCLEEARLFLSAALQEVLIAFETLDTFCATADEGELYWAQDSMEAAGWDVELANESMNSCPWTQ